MDTHYHFSGVTMVFIIALVLAVFGTAHLLAISSDTRPGRALLALGF